MRLTLTIENFARRPDGGPLSHVIEGAGGADIGRNANLDWALPDENHYISGRHCEIRARDGAYYLADVSKNGVYVNGEERRVQSPYRLADGDRLFIGDYIIAVRVEGAGRGVAPADIWQSSEPAPPPIEPRLLRPPPAAARHVDWPEHRANPLTPAPPRRAPLASSGGSLWRPAGASTEAPERSDAQEERPPQSSPPPGAAPAPPVPPRQESEAPDEGGHADFLAGFARALGVDARSVAAASPQQLGEDLGALMRLVADETMTLLKARAEAKRLTRSMSRTVIEAQDNNPLKFAPTSDSALRLLFGATRPEYLDARRAFEQAFFDLKTHQMRTYAAMQEAARRLGDGIDPRAIESRAEKDKGVSALLISRKARLWDAYVARWDAMSPRGEDKLADAFMRVFADCYDSADGRL